MVCFGLCSCVFHFHHTTNINIFSSFLVLSNWNFWNSCFLLTNLVRYGLTKFSLILSCRFMSNSAGLSPVVPWGVFLYLNRKSAMLCFSECSLLLSRTCLVNFSLNNLTALSAAPFDAGWYGATLIYLMPFYIINSLNSWAMNCGPLSDTNCSSKPCWAKINLNSLRVLSTVVLCIGLTSTNF